MGPRLIGKLNMYVEPGTVLGPNTTREFVTALEHICDVTDHGPDCYTTFRHTQTKDFSAVRDPRSVTEFAMMQRQPSIFGPVRSTEVIHSGVVAQGSDFIPARKIRSSQRFE